MKRITANTKIKNIKKIKEFKEFKEYLIPFTGINAKLLDQLPLKFLNKIWNVETIVDSFNYMKQLCNQGKKIFYQLHTKEEIEKNEGLKKNILFHFPIEHRSKFIVICAGGGYESVCSITEAFPVAKRMNELGYHAFVVDYRIKKNALVPNPQDDLASAIRYILDNSDVLNIEREDYAVAGFSAGGHLVASYGTKHLGYEYYDLPKPQVLFLAYPVITMTDNTHIGSRRWLLGKKNRHNDEIIEKYSIEKHVTEEYPATFMWQCNEDDTVSIENTMMMEQSLRDNHVKYTYKVYESTDHGWGLAENTLAEGWLDEAVLFWETLKD